MSAQILNVQADFSSLSKIPTPQNLIGKFFEMISRLRTPSPQRFAAFCTLAAALRPPPPGRAVRGSRNPWLPTWNPEGEVARRMAVWAPRAARRLQGARALLERTTLELTGGEAAGSRASTPTASDDVPEPDGPRNVASSV